MFLALIFLDALLLIMRVTQSQENYAKPKVQGNIDKNMIKNMII